MVEAAGFRDRGATSSMANRCGSIVGYSVRSLFEAIQSRGAELLRFRPGTQQPALELESRGNPPRRLAGVLILISSKPA